MKLKKKYILSFIGLFFVLATCLLSAYKKPSEGGEQIVTKPYSFYNPYYRYAENIYQEAHLKNYGLSFEVFEKGLRGYLNVQATDARADKALLAIADFDQNSTAKRLYLIDLKNDSLLLNSWVAHGKASGDDVASKFSNLEDSYSSSMGFFITGEEYAGAHGRSLKLDGLDSGFNDQARNRAIVIHGAPYVSESSIRALGRLGRSQGCPAVASELSDQVISTLGAGSILFINRSAPNYISTHLTEASAELAYIFNAGAMVSHSD
ncbi:murein L,D-transpeptidase catalytic domain family protein [Pedobacter sp. AW1-32]|uniref:murein L,D-transpeptidase catalytic domain family protein n=1 Tax=Pedobacter sp. AW1-32 TaxID=3383026 RepID=UPI003FF0392A